jgi:hypothetical protein
MIGMRVIEAHDLQTLLASVTLGANHLARIHMVSSMPRLDGRVPAAERYVHEAHVFAESADQDAATFLGIRFFGVTANILKVSCRDFEHKKSGSAGDQ